MTDHSKLGMKDFGALQTTQKRQKQPPINLIEIKISFHCKKFSAKKQLSGYWPRLAYGDLQNAEGLGGEKLNHTFLPAHLAYLCHALLKEDFVRVDCGLFFESD